jgi:Uma2 family endonuclease
VSQTEWTDIGGPGELGERRFVLHNVSWTQYLSLRELLDEQRGLRVTYLRGRLELMSPSPRHERIKTLIARLLEIYALEQGLALNGDGSTTFRAEAVASGLEPDECYSIGPPGDVPQMALEVVLQRGGIDKLEVYRGLEVPEVWIWQRDRLVIYLLGPTGYQESARSALLPDLDVVRLAGFVTDEHLADQTGAARAFRATLPR